MRDTGGGEGGRKTGGKNREERERAAVNELESQGGIEREQVRERGRGSERE